MREIAARADHVLLGTATPIQTRPEDLWDLMGILHQGKGNFVLGNDFALWHRPREVLPILSGEQEVSEPAFAWELLRSPLPLVDSTQEPRARRFFSAIRAGSGTGQRGMANHKTLTELTEDTREILEDELDRRIAGATLFQRENPLVRHIVLRKRVSLEDAGLLTKVGVDVHPDRQTGERPSWFDALFEGKALRTSENFREAYREARQFGKALAKRGKGGGFMKNLMEQRICSSIQAGLNTATMLLEGRTIHEEKEDDEEPNLTVETGEEREVLERLIAALNGIEEDPKLNAVILLPGTRRSGSNSASSSSASTTTRPDGWLTNWPQRYPDEAIGLYAGAGRSRLYQRGESVSCERETLKKMVAEHEIRIMVATDAACEGLNLQTLGTLINIDLPWNPTRLEQRIGRIKRFGQKRETVDMLNLVNEQTVDEKIYDRLSERMRNRYDLFGSVARHDQGRMDRGHRNPGRKDGRVHQRSERGDRIRFALHGHDGATREGLA